MAVMYSTTMLRVHPKQVARVTHVPGSLGPDSRHRHPATVERGVSLVELARW